MTQSQGALAGFFSGGGGKSAKFPTIGTTIAGTITAVHPPEPQRDFTTGLDVPGKTQVRIELATDQRDPEIEFDDGSRTLYVRGWMTGAIGEAIRKSGVKEPQIGGQLSVTYIKDGQPTRPGFQGPKQFSATYTPPTAAQASTSGFFNQAAPANVPIPDQPPAGIDPAAWAAMPADAKQAIANTLFEQQPPF
jgi:hypothetical protein